MRQSRKHKRSSPFDENKEMWKQKERYELKQRLIPDRQKLPVYEAKSSILKTISQNSVTILIGETGSGKTTQIPQFLLEDNLVCSQNDAKNRRTDGGMVAVTQPRRVAAMTVAKRVAQEAGTTLGARVGYTIRFEDETSKHTVVKYMTDGMLLREAMVDPLLQSYKYVILDEAHERSVNTDILLGVIKGILVKRSDLKLIVMSATLETAAFANFFPSAPILFVEGRQFPVEILYTREPQDDTLQAVISSVMQIHTSKPGGDILVFQTGQEEIEGTCRLLNERIQFAKRVAVENNLPLPKDMIICPMYAALPQEEQWKVFEPTPEEKRKVIVATNVAETSVTISGIKYVVDPGNVKVRFFSPKTVISALVVQPISQAMARQRTGRAGREQAGMCFRLYPENEFQKFAEASTPEILRTNLSAVVLQLSAIGVDILSFNFITKPSDAFLLQALAELNALGAFNRDHSLSPLGKRLAELPLEPTFAKTLLTADAEGVVDDVVTIISIMSANDAIFYRPKERSQDADKSHQRLSSPQGDHLTYLMVFNEFIKQPSRDQKLWCQSNFINQRCLRKALSIRGQLLEYCRSMNINPISNSSEDGILRSFVSGFFTQVALLQPDGRYLVVSKTKREEVRIHPLSTMCNKKPACVLYGELVQTTNKFMRDVSCIDSTWLLQMAPNYFKNMQLLS